MGIKRLEIDREDMLALTRRMTVKRSSITRIAGAYIDPDGFVDGTFNTRFLKLSGSDQAKNLEIAKTIPFADTNRNLKRFIVPDEKRGNGSLWQLLMGARAAGLEMTHCWMCFMTLWQRSTGPVVNTESFSFMTGMISRRRPRTMSGSGSRRIFSNI